MTTERELGWEDEIEKDGGDFKVLPAGDYNFTVNKFERGRFAGSAKMPACNQAKLEITVHSPEHGEVTIFHTLLLHTKTEGFLSNFFAGIGQKKKGEKLRMNWNTVTGAKGKLELGINKYIAKDGNERTNNEIKTFHPYDALQGQTQQSYQQPTYQQQQPPAQQQQHTQQTPFPTGNPPQQQGGGFTPGQF